MIAPDGGDVRAVASTAAMKELRVRRTRILAINVRMKIRMND